MKRTRDVGYEKTSIPPTAERVIRAAQRKASNALLRYDLAALLDYYEDRVTAFLRESRAARSH